MTEDLALVVAAAHEAGRLAMATRHKGLDVWTKMGGSPVTDADMAVDALLKDQLLTARPDYGWLSEETADSPARLERSRLFIVDPIDGTRAFVRGHPWFTVCIAVVQDGRPVAGVVHAPALDETYTAIEGQGAWLNGEPIRPSRVDRVEDCAMLADPRLFAVHQWPKPWPPMRFASRNSIAYRVALVAAGAFDATLSMSPKSEWDLAAADLIAREAGALCTDPAGERFVYNQPNPIVPGLVCAGPGLHSLILDRTRPVAD